MLTLWRRRNPQGLRRRARDEGTSGSLDVWRDMDRFWDLFRRGFGGGPIGDWSGDFAPAGFTPSVDVTDDGERIRVSAELPGMDAEDVDVNVSDGRLTISGEKAEESTETAEDESWTSTERRYGYFSRSIPLPSEVDIDATDANFKNGVLTITLPRTEPSSRRQIEVKGS